MRQAAMQRKGSFMDDMPPAPMDAGAGAPMGEDPMTMGFDEYVPGYDDMAGMEGEAGMEEPMDMEMRIASLEDRIAQLEAMLAG
jgi:hypothetical protein